MIVGYDSGPEVVLVTEGAVLIGRDPDSDCYMPHSTVSRWHATLSRTASGLVVADQDSRFGTFVNGVRVRTVALHVGDRVQFGSARPYRVHADGLRLDGVAWGLALSAQELSVARGGHTLVQGASFDIVPDSFVGILGPSGAGKSTLLTVWRVFTRRRRDGCTSRGTRTRAERSIFTGRSWDTCLRKTLSIPL
jgi:ABC-type multidrug transport system fused ATPase/permease subunit